MITKYLFSSQGKECILGHFYFLIINFDCLEKFTFCYLNDCFVGSLVKFFPTPYNCDTSETSTKLISIDIVIIETQLCGH